MHRKHPLACPVVVGLVLLYVAAAQSGSSDEPTTTTAAPTVQPPTPPPTRAPLPPDFSLAPGSGSGSGSGATSPPPTLAPVKSTPTPTATADVYEVHLSFFQTLDSLAEISVPLRSALAQSLSIAFEDVSIASVQVASIAVVFQVSMAHVSADYVQQAVQLQLGPSGLLNDFSPVPDTLSVRLAVFTPAPNTTMSVSTHRVSSTLSPLTLRPTTTAAPLTAPLTAIPSDEIPTPLPASPSTSTAPVASTVSPATPKSAENVMTARLGIIAGAVVGTVAVCCALAVVTWYCRKRSAKRKGMPAVLDSTQRDPGDPARGQFSGEFQMASAGGYAMGGVPVPARELPPVAPPPRLSGSSPDSPPRAAREDYSSQLSSPKSIVARTRNVSIVDANGLGLDVNGKASGDETLSASRPAPGAGQMPGEEQGGEGPDRLANGAVPDEIELDFGEFGDGEVAVINPR